MMTYDVLAPRKFQTLLDLGFLTVNDLRTIQDAAIARDIGLETILIKEYDVPRRVLLESLSKHYNCPYVEYDERMPIPPELLSGLDGEKLSMNQWFPIIKDGDTIVIAANNPQDPQVLSEVKSYIKAGRYEFRVTLGEDIHWFIQDFLHARPGHLIGTERTGLAFWRNTMALWRTRLAGYRNDLAKTRTDLSFLRWGLGFIAIADALMRMNKFGSIFYLYWVMIAAGFMIGTLGLSGYLKIRRSRMRPPGHHTLVEVTSATLHFLESYHFIENTGNSLPTKKTMLARLGDFLADHCTILYPSPASRERTHLARERNVLAGQRTVAACYRTIYARSRTGLAFIRTGVSFSALGLGLIKYFGFSLMTLIDSTLIAAGLLMFVDGILWYTPVRKERSEIPRCPVPEELL